MFQEFSKSYLSTALGDVKAVQVLLAMCAVIYLKLLFYAKAIAQYCWRIRPIRQMLNKACPLAFLHFTNTSIAVCPYQDSIS